MRLHNCCGSKTAAVTHLGSYFAQNTTSTQPFSGAARHTKNWLVEQESLALSYV